MAKIYIFDRITEKDITPFVTIGVDKDGNINVFNSLGVNITENIFFGVEGEL